MTAERLREAATVLRERGSAATPGPWTVDGQGPGPDSKFMGCGVVWTMHPDLFGGDIAGPAGDCYPRSGYSPADDMTLIATMHPGVALAVADWLDHAASISDTSTGDSLIDAEAAAGGCDCPYCKGLPLALAVADAVLGGEFR